MPQCGLATEPKSGNPKLVLGDLLVVTKVPENCIYGFAQGDLLFVTVCASKRSKPSEFKVTDLRTGNTYYPAAITTNTIRVRVLSSSEPITLVPN